MKRPTRPVRDHDDERDAVAVAKQVVRDWNAAWKAMTSGLMRPTNTWKSSQPRMFPSAGQRRRSACAAA